MLRVAFALLFGILSTPLAPAQSMSPSMGEAAAQLSARIYSLLQRRTTVSLDFQNLTALPAAESSNFRSALEEDLRKAGLELTVAQPESRLRVAISENVRGLLLVAVVTSGDNRQVAMLPWSAPPPAEIKPRVKISVHTLREQSEAMLDILLLDSGSQLLVLGTNKVSSFRLVNGAWTPAGIAGLALTRPLPRDPRGRMENTPAGFSVYLPGTSCSGALQPEFKITCAAGNEAWPLNPHDPGLAVRWVTDRNLLESDNTKGTFYTSAAGWVVNSEGRTVDRMGAPLGGADRWGSELAAVENPCHSGWMLLAAKGADAGESDQVQAYEAVDSGAIAASEPIPLPGSVMALWPAETPGEVTLVVRNSKTGNYEASRLGVACAE
jgi:hypothetical protein